MAISHFGPGNGGDRGRKAWRSVGIHCARKALQGQIGTAQHSVHLSVPCRGKLKTSRRDDKRFVGI
jgi:hypothetical protein